jgi:hypothetical protein
MSEHETPDPPATPPEPDDAELLDEELDGVSGGANVSLPPPPPPGEVG